MEKTQTQDRDFLERYYKEQVRKRKTGGSMKIKIAMGSTGFFWKLIATNGQTLAHSETYSSKTKALQTAKKVAEELSVVVKVEQ